MKILGLLFINCLFFSATATCDFHEWWKYRKTSVITRKKMGHNYQKLKYPENQKLISILISNLKNEKNNKTIGRYILTLGHLSADENNRIFNTIVKYIENDDLEIKRKAILSLGLFKHSQSSKLLLDLFKQNKKNASLKYCIIMAMGIGRYKE